MCVKCKGIFVLTHLIQFPYFHKPFDQRSFCPLEVWKVGIRLSSLVSFVLLKARFEKKANMFQKMMYK